MAADANGRQPCALHRPRTIVMGTYEMTAEHRIE